MTYLEGPGFRALGNCPDFHCPYPVLFLVLPADLLIHGIVVVVTVNALNFGPTHDELLQLYL